MTNLERLKAVDISGAPDLYLLADGSYHAISLLPDAKKLGDIQSLGNEPIRVGDNSNFKLDFGSSIEKARVVSQIEKKNQQYLNYVGYEYMGNRNVGSRFLDHEIEVFKSKLPLGFSIEKDTIDVPAVDTHTQFLLVGLLISTMLIISAIMLESLYLPLILLTSIPLSLIGCFLMFIAMEVGFDQGIDSALLFASSLVAVPVLAVLNEYKRAGSENTVDAYLLSLSQIIKFVSYTTISTLAVSLTFLLTAADQSFWYSLAAASTGGVLFSCFTAIFIVPLLIIRRQRKVVQSGI